MTMVRSRLSLHNFGETSLKLREIEIKKSISFHKEIDRNLNLNLIL